MMWRKDRPASEGAEPAARRHAWLFGFLLAAITIIAYHPAWHAGFIWDDDDYVTKNPLLTAVDGLRRIWFSLDSPSQYFPLTYTTFYFEHFCWGLNPAGYHLVNLLLHAANALLVWQLLTRLRLPGAWLAAALFALHPVQVESAAWITERKNVLMGLFFLLSLLQWVRFIDSATLRPWRHYLLALIFYALALCAKTTACTLPVALLLILWLKHMPLEKKRWLQVLPFFAMGLAMGLVTIWWERYHQGTQGKLFAMGPLARVLLANRALWFYLGKLLWPINLIFSYPHWNISVSDPLAYLWVALTLAAAVVIWRLRSKTGRGLEVAALFFAATLAPTLGFIMLYTFVYSFVADHYQYLACIGPFALVAGVLATFWQRQGRPLVGPVLCGVLLLTLSVLTWRQCRIYSNLITLWQDTIDKNPRSWMAHENLGAEYLDAGNFDRALAETQKAIEINPEDAEAYYNLGNYYEKKGDLDSAIQNFQKAIALQPAFAHACNNLGNALFKKGEFEQAIPQYQRALELQANFAEAHFNYGNALMRAGRINDAIEQFKSALAIQQNYPEASFNLGNAYRQAGQLPNAIASFQQAARDLPTDARPLFALGMAFAQTGQMDEAIHQFQKAIAIEPKNADAHLSLGNAFLQKGQLDAALPEIQKALAIQPGFAQAQNELAAIAWQLATSPNSSMRNGGRAVEIATQLDQLAGGGNFMFAATLAAAEAEAGRFAEAVAAAQRARQLAVNQKNTAAIQAIEGQLKLYHTGRPFHQMSSSHGAL